MTVALSADQTALLRRMRNGILATVGTSGTPHAGPVWFFWDGEAVRVSTPGGTGKVADIQTHPQVAFCVDDQVAGEYLTIYGRAEIVTGDQVTDLTWPLLLAYHHPAEAQARWTRINADGSRIVILIRPERIAGRQSVR